MLIGKQHDIERSGKSTMTCAQMKRKNDQRYRSKVTTKVTVEEKVQCMFIISLSLEQLFPSKIFSMT